MFRIIFRTFAKRRIASLQGELKTLLEQQDRLNQVIATSDDAWSSQLLKSLSLDCEIGRVQRELSRQETFLGKHS